MSDNTSRWQIPAPMPKLVAPWRRQEAAEPTVSKLEKGMRSDNPDATPIPEWEQRAIAILAGRIDGESASTAFARKENELKEVFETLTIAESRALHGRLTMPKDGDELAQLFGRLVADRRARLVAFVADARRREAVLAARMK